jgi:hypothetical protein
MEKLEQTSNQENNNKYESLKEELSEGSISFEDVRDRLLKLDQSTPSRDASEENLNFLRDPQVVALIQKKTEFLEEYQGFVSFTEFHVAQRLMMNDSQDGIEHFKKALESAQMDTRFGESWAAYVEGTLLYLEGKEIPEEIIVKVVESRNAEILSNFNRGLKKRGTPLYEEDYGK